MCKKYLTSILFSTSIFLIGCSNSTNADLQSLKTEKEVAKKEAEKLSPEDDPNLKGTPVLSFKIRDSTFESHMLGGLFGK
jgi:PBP1b-binding outer membrane lipoprotein LpoB